MKSMILVCSSRIQQRFVLGKTIVMDIKYHNLESPACVTLRYTKDYLIISYQSSWENPLVY